MKNWIGHVAATGAAKEFGIATGELEILDDASICSTPGIAAAGTHAGVKAEGALDLALVDAGVVCNSAGVFTSNRAKAAPVLVSIDHLADGKARGIAANSGCANACTGERGVEDSIAMTAAAADLFACAPSQVLVASTGLIGFYLPIAAVTSGISGATLGTDSQCGHAAARAIMTTDTVPKEAAVKTSVGGKEVTVSGMAKGAAMLAPSMATMLGFITTDASIEADVLQVALRSAVASTFNRISVDACQSTNDTVVALATGTAGNQTIDTPGAPGFLEVGDAISEVCAQLALKMVCDGEGATKVARIAVNGAASASDALAVARAIASSVLVRCSLHGADPYWGRIASEIGASGADEVRPELVSISYGGTAVAAKGVAIPHDEDLVREHMAKPIVEIVCDLGLGDGSSVMFSCDLGPGYIEENRGTS